MTGTYDSSYAYTYAQPAGKAKKPKKEKKSGERNFFVKAVTWVLIAVLLGGVAGGACYGVSYLGYRIFPVSTSDSSSSSASKSSGTTSQLSNIKTNVTTDLTATVMDVSDIVDYVISSVVAIDGSYTTSVNYGWMGNQTYQTQVSGSGIIIGITDEELLIVTNDHVVDGVENLAVTFYDGSEATAAIKGTKSAKDLAVLSVKLEDIPDDAVYSIAALGDSSEVEVGEAAIAIGNSLGEGISVTTGCVSATGKSVTVDDVVYEDLIQTDAAINAGNSGGALFNASGEVIGINSVKMSSTGVEGMGYAISISSVKDIIDELSIMEVKEALSEDERGYLGIVGTSITEEINQLYGYPIGAVITSVTEDSAADKAGLCKNDIIVAVNDEKIETISDLVTELSYYAAGEKVTVEYYRMNDKGEYEKASTEVTLMSNPN